MKRRRRRTPSVRKLQLGAVLASLPTMASAQSGLAAYASQARWGQAWTLLPDPALLVYGGAVAGDGQTYTSAPSTNDLLLLPLNSSFSGTSAPWTYLAGSQLASSQQGPATSWGAVGVLSGADQSLLFGGVSSSVPVQTANDSAYTLLSPTSQASLTAVPVSAGQPMRRERHTLASAYSGSSSLAWIFGGLKADGSMTPFAELWQSSTTTPGGSTSSWTNCAAGPEAVYDHAAAITTSTDGQTVQMWVVGGATPGVGGTTGMADMASPWRFTPDLSGTSPTCGTWDVVRATGSAPSPRRGHAWVSLSPTTLLLFGGASQDGTSVYSDVWTLDTGSMSWTELDPRPSAKANAPAARWGHAMVRVGTEVVVAMGYGAIGDAQPVDSTVWVYDINAKSWSTDFTGSLTTPGGTGGTAVAGGGGATTSAVGGTTTAMPISNPTGAPTGQTTGSPNGAGTTGVTGGGGTTLRSGAAASSAAKPHSSSGWQSPGSAQPAGSVPGTTPNTSNDAASSTSKPKVIGVTVGLLSVAALAAGAGYYFYRRRQRKAWRAEAAAYRRTMHHGAAGGGGRRRGSDDDGDEAVQGLVGGAATGGNEMTEARDVPSNGGALHGPRRPFTGVAAVGGFLAGRQQRRHASAGRAQRFDMLADEESDVWNVGDATLTDDEEEDEAQEVGRVRGPRPFDAAILARRARDEGPIISTRGGTRIWNDEPAQSEGQGTVTSFLGASLAPWSDDGQIPSGMSEVGTVDQYSDPFADSVSTGGGRSIQLRPSPSPAKPPMPSNAAAAIAAVVGGRTPAGGKRKPVPRWSSPPTSPTKTRVVPAVSDDSHESHVTRTSGAANSGVSAGSHAPSLGLDVLAPAVPPLPVSSINDGLRRQGTWWDRIRQQPVGTMSPGASNPIRDPAPPPALAIITEADATDPFVDSPVSSSTLHGGRNSVDEHGRREGSGTLQSDTQSSGHTATSSMIEEAAQNMMVVQRLRSASSTNLLDSPQDSIDSPVFGDQTPRLSAFAVTPQLDAFEAGAPRGVFSPAGETIWNGPEMWDSPSGTELGGGATPALGITSPPQALPRSSGRPIDLRASQASSTYTNVEPTALRRAPTAGTVGVKAMVQQYEKRASPSNTPLIPGTPGDIDSPSFPASTATTPERHSKSSLSSSESARQLKRASLGPAGGNKAKKVEHGLVRKPVLYVANPDDQ